MPKTEVKVIDMPKQRSHHTTRDHHSNNQISRNMDFHQSPMQIPSGQIRYYEQGRPEGIINSHQKEFLLNQTSSPSFTPQRNIVDRYEIDLVQLSQADRGSFTQNPPSPKFMNNASSSDIQSQGIKFNHLEKKLSKLTPSEQIQFSPSIKMNMSSQESLKPKLQQNVNNSLINAQNKNSLQYCHNTGTILNNFNIQNNITNMSNEAKIEKIVETVYDSLDKLKFYFMCSVKELEVKLRKEYTDKFESLNQRLNYLDRGIYQEQQDDIKQSLAIISQEFQVPSNQVPTQDSYRGSQNGSPSKHYLNSTIAQSQQSKNNSSHVKQQSISSNKVKRSEDKSHKKNNELKQYQRTKATPHTTQHSSDQSLIKSKSANNCKVQKPKKIDVVLKDNIQMFKQYSRQKTENSDLAVVNFTSPKASSLNIIEPRSNEKLSQTCKQIFSHEQQNSKAEIKANLQNSQITIMPVTQETKNKQHIEAKAQVKVTGFINKISQKATGINSKKSPNENITVSPNDIKVLPHTFKQDDMKMVCNTFSFKGDTLMNQDLNQDDQDEEDQKIQIVICDDLNGVFEPMKILSQRIIKSSMNQVRQISGPKMTSMLNISETDFISANNYETKKQQLLQEEIHSSSQEAINSLCQSEKNEALSKRPFGSSRPSLQEMNPPIGHSPQKQIKSFLKELEEDEFIMNDYENGQSSHRQDSPRTFRSAKSHCAEQNDLAISEFVNVRAINLDIELDEDLKYSFTKDHNT